MSSKKPEDGTNVSETSASSGEAVTKSRRDVVKKTVAVGGITVALSNWSKPVVESVVLPAHAQTTGGPLVAFVFNL
ncbi:MAG: hypothetical protein DHS20C01_33810 [marine bacterium B5-7]|nr:MAG: hypothetical protein DHS20C01_33810 [marine bacterium B5-7]